MNEAQVPPGYKRTEAGVIPEDWGVSAIGEIGARFLSGGTPSTEVQEYWIGSIPWITAGDIADQRLTEVRRYISEQAVRSSATNVVSAGNLLVATRTGVGKLAIPEYDVAFSQDLTGVIINEQIALTAYVFRALDYRRGMLERLVQGTSIAGITRETLLGIQIPLPSLPEQRAIAGALSDADAWIAALDKLIAKKRGLKQAAMDELLTGRTRLPGFQKKAGTKRTEVGVIPEDWDVRRIEELFDFLSNSSCSRSDLTEDGEVFYIHYGDIHTKWDYMLDFSSVAVPRIKAEKVHNATPLRDGDLVLVDASEDEEGAGKGVEIMGLQGRWAVAGLHTIALRPKRNDLADGFKAYIQAMPGVKRQIRQLITGLKVFGISKTNLASVLIPLPPLPEQRAIAQVLSDMDAEIEALERKRAKAQAIKQGMMQELLTGRIRLV